MKEEFKKVLCVCTFNHMRSPTMAWVLSNPPFNFNARSCGIDQSGALIPISRFLLEWADEIVCARDCHYDYVQYRLRDLKDCNPVVICLDIPDIYEYRTPILKKIIKVRYNAATKAKNNLLLPGPKT